MDEQWMIWVALVAATVDFLMELVRGFMGPFEGTHGLTGWFQ